MSAFDPDIEKLVTELRQPAGPSPQFADDKGIDENREAFVLRVHETWKRLHIEAIHNILTWDAFARRETQHPTHPVVAAFGEYNRQVWRKVNDAIIWSLFGMQRHVVKRICLYRDRTYLEECNYSVAMEVIEQINSNPLSIAVWNDATSVVDIGDLTFVESGLKPNPAFLELKEGSVNDKIVDLLSLDGLELEEGLRAIEERYGKKGRQQYERAKRQKQTSDQALQVLKNDGGVDPVTGSNLKVVDIGDEALETYDSELNDLLKESLSKETPLLRLVAGCIWVYASPDTGNDSLLDVRRSFVSKLTETRPSLKVEFDAERPKWDKDRIESLGSSFFAHVAIPPFFRNLDPHIVAAITFGKLMERVHLYLDWELFVSIVEASGAEFVWGTGKEVGRVRAMNPKLRSPIVNGKVPQLRWQGVTAPITDPNLVQILFDGITPRAIIGMMAKLMESLPRGEGR